MATSKPATKASSIPWSIKGVSDSARAQAKRNAQDAGMTIGQWLSRQILLNSNGISLGSQEEVSQTVEKIDDLSTHLNELIHNLDNQ